MPVKDARQELKDKASELLKTWLPRLSDPEYMASTSLGKALAGFSLAASPGVALAAPLLANTLGNKQVGEVMDAYDMATKGMPLAGQADDALRLLAKTGPGLAVVPPMQRYYGRMKARGIPAGLSDIWHSALAEVMDKKFLEPGNPTDLVPLREIQEFVKNKLPGMGVPKNEMAHFNLDDYIRNKALEGYLDKQLASLPTNGNIIGTIEDAPAKVLTEYNTNPNELLRNIKVSRQDLADYIDKRIPALDLQPEGTVYSNYTLNREIDAENLSPYSDIANTAAYQAYRIMNPSSLPKQKDGLYIDPNGKVGINFDNTTADIPPSSLLRINPTHTTPRHFGNNEGEVGFFRVTGPGGGYDPSHGMIVEEVQSDTAKSPNWPLGRFADIAIPAIRKIAQEAGADKFTVVPSGVHTNRYRGFKREYTKSPEAIHNHFNSGLFSAVDHKDALASIPPAITKKYVEPFQQQQKLLQSKHADYYEYIEQQLVKQGLGIREGEVSATGMDERTLYDTRARAIGKLRETDPVMHEKEAELAAMGNALSDISDAFDSIYLTEVAPHLKEVKGVEQRYFQGYKDLYDNYIPAKLKQMAKQTGETVGKVNDIKTTTPGADDEPFMVTRGKKYSVGSINDIRSKYNRRFDPYEMDYIEPNFNEIFEYKINPDLRVTFPFWGK